MTHDLDTTAREGAQRLHAAMAKAGHPVTPEEATFLWAVGLAATGETLGLDSSPMNPTLDKLAKRLPKVGDERAARERAVALAAHR
jgi:hypothetical protein